MTMYKLPLCNREEKDCHSISPKGKCTLLKDTKFKRPCPFYLSGEQVKAENLKYFPRLQYQWGTKK